MNLNNLEGIEREKEKRKADGEAMQPENINREN